MQVTPRPSDPATHPPSNPATQPPSHPATQPPATYHQGSPVFESRSPAEIRPTRAPDRARRPWAQARLSPVALGCCATGATRAASGRRRHRSPVRPSEPGFVAQTQVKHWRAGVATQQPSTQPPSNPATQPPSNPATQQPSHPATQQPSHPATQPPTDPATQRPSHPATQRPSDPATQPPSDPATQRPSNPATQPPSDPATQLPSHPATQLLLECVSSPLFHIRDLAKVYRMGEVEVHALAPGQPGARRRASSSCCSGRPGPASRRC